MRRTLALASALALATVGAVVMITAPAHAAPWWSGPVSDYDGDGFGDIVVGEPQLTIDGVLQAGAVRVYYGSVDGPVNSHSNQYFHQGMPLVPGALGQARFGHAIASGNFDGDKYTDVAIGAPVANGVQGEVVVLYGAYGGLNRTAEAQAKSELLTAAAYVAGDDTGPTTKFGHALAAADFNSDGYADLAIGASGALTGGGVRVLFGGPNGLAPSAANQWIDQDSPGMPSAGTAQTVDEFGAKLAAGDVNGDGRPDLAVGAPGKAVNGFGGAGQVFVLLAGPAGTLATTGALAFDQETPGVPGSAATDDHFGITLATGDITGDGSAELAIASDGAQLVSGAVFVLKGSSSGPTAAGAQAFFGGEADKLGQSIAILDTDANRYLELVIGVPGQTVAGQGGAGVVRVWEGTPDGASGPVKQWNQDITGIQDSAHALDGFGSSLLATFNKSSHTHRLVIGVPGEDFKSCTDCGLVATINGGPSGLTATGNQLVGRGSGYGDFAYALG